MIRYALKCTDGHGFESWFESGDAFDKLLGRGLITCPHCGVTAVEKAIMAPRVAPTRAAPAQQDPQDAGPPRTTPADAPPEALIAKMRAHLEANSEYVGDDFATAAREMHEGRAPERSIHGEAKAKEAKALIEDGIPVAPLPFSPTRKMN